MMLSLYRLLTLLLTPFIALWLVWRLLKGKESRLRLGERFGRASIARPAGDLVWIHAASVGELNAILPLVESVLEQRPTISLLVTTGTVTSALLAEKRLPDRALHQFVPVDLPMATRRFMHHWQPTVAVWSESEFWPNLMRDTAASSVPMLLVNARLSARSCRRWQWARTSFARLLGSFEAVYASSESDAARLRSLGIATVQWVGNLKYDTHPLPYDTDEYDALNQAMVGRPVWLAASTHAGEEEQIIVAHRLLRDQFPTLLTLLVPRHAQRSSAIRQLLNDASLHSACRSLGQPITPQTELYLADTLGEMGLWFRLSPIVFLGGSLVPVGGHNPIEPALLKCAITCGTHMHHFADLYDAWVAEKALTPVADATALATQIGQWLQHPDQRDQAAQHAYHAVISRQGAVAVLRDVVLSHLSVTGEN